MKYKINYRNYTLYGGSVVNQYCNDYMDDETENDYDFYEVDKYGNIIKQLSKEDMPETHKIKICDHEIKERLVEDKYVHSNLLDKKIEKYDKDIKKLNKLLKELNESSKKIIDSDVFQKTVQVKINKEEYVKNWFKNEIINTFVNKSEEKRTCNENELYELLSYGIGKDELNKYFWINFYKEYSGYIEKKFDTIYNLLKNNNNLLKNNNNLSCKKECENEIEKLYITNNIDEFNNQKKIIEKKFKSGSYNLGNNCKKFRNEEFYKKYNEKSRKKEAELLKLPERSKNVKEILEELYKKKDSYDKNEVDEAEKFQENSKKIKDYLLSYTFNDSKITKDNDGYLYLKESLSSGSELYKNFYNVLSYTSDNSGPIGWNTGSGYWINLNENNKYYILKLLLNIKKSDIEFNTTYIDNMINYIDRWSK